MEIKNIFSWVRGGAWREEEGSLILVGFNEWIGSRKGKLKTASELPAAEERKAETARRAKIRGAWKQLQIRDGGWQADCGDALGLSRYVLDEARCDRALDVAAGYAEAWAAHAGDRRDWEHDEADVAETWAVRAAARRDWERDEASIAEGCAQFLR